MLTQFGWSVRGPILTAQLHIQNKEKGFLHTVKSRSKGNLEELVHRRGSWNSLLVPIPIQNLLLSKEGTRALTNLKETVNMTETRYEAGLLWRVDTPILPNNFAAAINGFLQVKRRIILSACQSVY